MPWFQWQTAALLQRHLLVWYSKWYHLLSIQLLQHPTLHSLSTRIMTLLWSTMHMFLHKLGSCLIHLRDILYMRISMTRVIQVSKVQASQRLILESLVDWCSNPGVARAHVWILVRDPDKFADLMGIDNHLLKHIPVVSCGALALSCNHSPVVDIFVDLQSYHLDNWKHTRTTSIAVQQNAGYELPLHVSNDLAYL